MKISKDNLKFYLYTRINKGFNKLYIDDNIQIKSLVEFMDFFRTTKKPRELTLKEFIEAKTLFNIYVSCHEMMEIIELYNRKELRQPFKFIYHYWLKTKPFSINTIMSKLKM